MGKYDILDKDYFLEGCHFSELITNGIYHGRVRVTPELKQFFRAMQSRYDKHKLAELFEREEFQNLSGKTQRVIAVHLNIKELRRKVLEEDEEMCKAYRDLVKDWKQEGRQEGRQEGLLFAVRNLMASSHLTAEQAMDILKIAGEDRIYCLRAF